MTTTDSGTAPDDAVPAWAIPSDEVLDALETDDDDPSGSGPEPADDQATGNSEAARYRRRLRDVEAERDGLRDRVEALQRAQVEQLAGPLKPAALWSATLLEDVLDAEGNVDRERVAEAVRTARDRLGIPVMAPDPSQGRGGQGPSARLSWTDALKTGGAR